MTEPDWENGPIEEILRLREALTALLAATADISDPHHERMSGVGKGNCVECRYPWPCPTEQIASAARAAAAAVLGGES